MADKLLRFKDILEMDSKDPLNRSLSFNDMHVTQYMPGEDELTNYRAYRRKRTIGVGEGGPIGESTDAYGKSTQAIADKKKKDAMSSSDKDKLGKLAAMMAKERKPQKEGLFDRIGDKVAKAKRAIANGMPKHVAMAKYLVTSKELGEETEVDEALTVQQRLARKRMFKRIQPKIKRGREIAKRRIAGKDKLMKRARKQIRTMFFKKFTKDIPKSELTYARRKEIEKRLEKPAIKRRIDQLAKKQFPKTKRAELAKKRGGNK